jgi:hypothetical protein
MARRKKDNETSQVKKVVRLPDLEQSKNAVLNSVAAASSQESYANAVDQFIGGYCSGELHYLRRVRIRRSREVTSHSGKYS